MIRDGHSFYNYAESPMTDYTNEAWYQACVAMVNERHGDRLDKRGKPRGNHFVTVATRLKRMFPDASRAELEAALLHDVSADDPEKAAWMRDHGILPETIRILGAIQMATSEEVFFAAMVDLCKTGDTSAIRVRFVDGLESVENLARDGTMESDRRLAAVFGPVERVLRSALRYPDGPSA